MLFNPGSAKLKAAKLKHYTIHNKMLQQIFQRLRRLSPSSMPGYIPLGRWCRTEKSHNDVKVDLANMDHCGTCNHDNIKESPNSEDEIKKTKFDYPKIKSSNESLEKF